MRAAIAAIFLAGCSGAPFTENVYIVQPGDSGPLGAIAAEAGTDPPDASADVADPPDASVAVSSQDADASSDAGPLDSAAEDASCSVEDLPPGWSPSDPSVGCGAELDSVYECPACLPFAYNCASAQRYPAALASLSAVVLAWPKAGPGAVCASAAVCVDEGLTLSQTYCPHGQGELFSCAMSVDGGQAARPMADCTPSGASLYGYCCQIDGGSK